MNEAELFIITGASGAGKTALIPFLQKQIPDKFKIYDFDEILRPFDGTDEWALEVIDKMMQLTDKNRKDGFSTIVAGLIRPFQVEKIVPHYGINNIKLLLLDITTEERARRLTERGDTMELIGDIEEHEGFRSWINEARYPSEVIDTSDKKPEEVAREISNWINSN